MSIIREKTIKRLFAVSGNLCSFSDCRNSLIDRRTGTVIGEICHIKGENRRSARYDPAQSAEERRGYENLILMCPVHHKIIDANEHVYTVTELQRIKTFHEITYSSHQLLLNDEAAREFLTKIESDNLNNGSIIVVNAPQNGQVAHSITNSDSRPPIFYRRTAQTKLQLGSCQITTKLIFKTGLVILLIAFPLSILVTTAASVLVMKILPGLMMIIGFGFVFAAKPLQRRGYERIGAFNLECNQSGDIYLTHIEGSCPFCESVVNLKQMPKGSSLKIMGFCERNSEMHTFSFDHTTLSGVYYPIKYEKSN